MTWTLLPGSHPLSGIPSALSDHPGDLPPQLTVQDYWGFLFLRDLLWLLILLASVFPGQGQAE